MANKDRIFSTIDMGQGKMTKLQHKLTITFTLVLLDSNECMGHEAEVSGYTESLKDQWDQLLEKIEEKTQKLREANQQQQFNEAVNDMDFWLGEVRIVATKSINSQCFQTTDSAGICVISFFVSCLFKVEAQLSSEDCGRDLAGVQNLLKKHQLLERDVMAREDRLGELSGQAEKFVKEQHFDAENIQEKHQSISDRYSR